MALELAGNVGNLFLNSKYNNEGLTQRQTKIVKIINQDAQHLKVMVRQQILTNRMEGTIFFHQTI